MVPKVFFVAGTDTDVGKTFVSVALIQAANSRGLKTFGLKPVAAGCRWQGGQLINDDALAIQTVASVQGDYAQINPVALEPPIAPHIAAEQVGMTLTASHLASHCKDALTWAGQERACSFAIIEGAGGWRVPLNQNETLADLAIQLNAPVILVVGMRLGCINHALLSAEAIIKDGLVLAGWVANQIDPNMPVSEENITSLKSRMPCPLLGHMPFLSKSDPFDISRCLDIDKLMV